MSTNNHAIICYGAKVEFPEGTPVEEIYDTSDKMHNLLKNKGLHSVCTGSEYDEPTISLIIADRVVECSDQEGRIDVPLSIMEKGYKNDQIRNFCDDHGLHIKKLGWHLCTHYV